MLRRGEIFFASPSELNDAHECRPQLILNGTTELWQRLAYYILLDLVVAAGSRFRKETSKKVLAMAGRTGSVLKAKLRSRDLEIGNLGPLFVEAITPLLSAAIETQALEGTFLWLNRFIREDLPSRLSQNYYIACFSQNATNPTMWGHYANAERGFVIIYQTKNGTIHVHSPLKVLTGTRPLKHLGENVWEHGLYREEHLKLHPVIYRKNPPKVNAFHRLIPMFYYSEKEAHYDAAENLMGDAKIKEEERLGLVKFSDWKYEREVRVFLPQVSLVDQRQSICPDMRVLRVSGENVVGLIFGPKMSEENKQRAVTCCYLMRKLQLDESKADLVIFQAEQQPDHFALQIRPLGILDTPRYDSASSHFKPLSKLTVEKQSDLLTMANAVMLGAKENTNPSHP